MTSVRPLFVLLAIWFCAGSAYAAGDGSDAQVSAASVQNQTTDPALFGQSAQSVAPDLFFLKDKPRLKFATPARQARPAVMNDADCYTMRMYKVKRKEHFADGESGLRGYSTCELASNYQVRSAIAHVETAEGQDARSDEPQK
jgi:hypothetical protein